jgi:hypothetical protein
MHAFVDESIRSGSYRLTVVVAKPSDLAELGRAIRTAVPKGGKRTHLSAESHSRRRQILNAFGRLPISASVYITDYRRGDNEEPARQRCLLAMVSDMEALQVTIVVLDTRGPERDLQDRRTISKAVRDGSAPQGLTFAHRGSRDEFLLGLPDAIGWADGAGARYSSLIEAVTTRKIVA